MGSGLNAITNEWGGTLAVLGAAALNGSEPEASLDFAGIRVTSRDRRADRYLASRFDPQFPLELKVMILMIEGDLNTARLILPRTARGHQDAAFRARTVTAGAIGVKEVQSANVRSVFFIGSQPSGI